MDACLDFNLMEMLKTVLSGINFYWKELHRDKNVLIKSSAWEVLLVTVAIWNIGGLTLSLFRCSLQTAPDKTPPILVADVCRFDFSWQLVFFHWKTCFLYG